jgi:hypothetical protein
MDGDINSPTLFPYAIAAVCPRWRDIMSLVPEYWTRIVTVVDLIPTTPPATVLSWSRNLPLEVIVTRVDFDRAVDAQHEQDHVVSVMKTLVQSHARRCQELRFNVKFSSSLPPFPDSFQGAWSNLSELELECQEDNGRSTDIWGLVTSTDQALEYPALKRLVIDGRNYYNACRKDSQWMVRWPSIYKMAISQYTPLPGESFSSTDLILPIIDRPSITELHINDLSLHPSPSTLAGTLLPDGGHILLSHIRDFELIADILDLLQDEPDEPDESETLGIMLTRCAMGHPRRPFNWEGSLDLKDIEADEDLVPLLRCWQGRSLSVHNCPGFNDAVLDLMAISEAGKYLYAPCLVYLVITDCPNFSAAALRGVIDARLKVHHGRVYPGINEIYIAGLAPNISTEDQQQISQQVYEFTYGPSPS